MNPNPIGIVIDIGKKKEPAERPVKTKQFFIVKGKMKKAKSK